MIFSIARGRFAGASATLYGMGFARALVRAALDLMLPARAAERRLRAVTAADFAAHVARPSSAAARDADAEAFACFAYQGLVRDALLALKFRGGSYLAHPLAEAAYDILLAELADRALFSGLERPLLLPLPLSRRRERERGHNQTELLARELAALDGGRSFELAMGLLVKTRDAPPQTSLPNRAAREKNVRRAFEVVNATRIAGRNIILLDDITTTGATLREASAALRAAGATQVFCVALAH